MDLFWVFFCLFSWDTKQNKLRQNVVELTIAKQSSQGWSQKSVFSDGGILAWEFH